MFSVHQDTVPVDGMTVEPFTPTIADGRLYGRGACDVKGGMAAMLAAISRLVAERPPGMPTVVLACTVNEEYGFSGAAAIRDLCLSGKSEMIPRCPDAAVIAEPTSLDVVVAHKGVVRWRCITAGRAVHASCPEAGDNAIYKMARVLTALERYQRDIVPRLAAHPQCGSATISVGMIHGGISVNIVPDRCTIDIDRRLPAGENAEDARRHLADYLRQCPELDFPVEHEPSYMHGPPLSDDRNGRIACRLSALARAVGGRSQHTGAPYATDAGFIGQAVPCVVFGPGSIAQAHTKDEWIALDQLQQAAEILYRLGRAGLSG
jgi:acetylornithine deacetylase